MLMRLENESGSNLVIGTLCLLEASFAGLYELELRQILGHENTLMPPSPFDEKGIEDLITSISTNVFSYIQNM